jgi:hypothetical protein
MNTTDLKSTIIDCSKNFRLQQKVPKAGSSCGDMTRNLLPSAAIGRGGLILRTPHQIV